MYMACIIRDCYTTSVSDGDAMYDTARLAYTGEVDGASTASEYTEYSSGEYWSQVTASMYSTAECGASAVACCSDESCRRYH